MKNKQYVVIGLGRFGTSVAQTLFKLGNDVLAIDKNEDRVQDISDNVTHSVIADATEENNLKALGIRNFDVAVVTIGSNIQSSIMATLLCKELGIKYIIAKANTDVHAKVLTKIGANKIIFPEKDMGIRVAHNLVSSNILDYIELSPDYSIVEVVCPKEWQGKSLNKLNLRSRYNINVMAIKRGHSIDVSPSPEKIIEDNDVIVVIGGTSELGKLESVINKG